MPDLWPADLGTGTVTPPVSLMREQAEFLTRKTKGKLEGRVISNRAGRDFQHQFFVVAPALDDYSYRLFMITHPIEFYPLSFFSDSKESGEVQCATEQSFVVALKETLGHPRTKEVIGAILAQIESETKDVPF